MIRALLVSILVAKMLVASDTAIDCVYTHYRVISANKWYEVKQAQIQPIRVGLDIHIEDKEYKYSFNVEKDVEIYTDVSDNNSHVMKINKRRLIYVYSYDKDIGLMFNCNKKEKGGK